MAPVSKTSKPLILIVEDNAPSLRVRQRLFESFGCETIGAISADMAVDAMSASPSIDLVITDINMGADATDKSGISLARMVREGWRDVPIVGYSAHFAEEDLSGDELGAFDLSFAKGAQRVSLLERQIEACIDLARDTRERRSKAPDETTLRGQYIVSVVPGASGGGAPSPQTAHVDVVQAQYAVSLKRSGQDPRTFSVWLTAVEEGWECDVLEYPELRAPGQSPSEAIESLLDLMAVFWDEIAVDEPRTAHLDRLAVFLRHLFSVP